MSMKLFLNRLETFKAGWELNIVTPPQLAKAGLYYFGKLHCVKCAFCFKEFDNWLCGDDPTIKHKKQSPQCLYFKIKRNNDLHGPCFTIFDVVPKKLPRLLSNVGLLQDVKLYQPFITIEDRLKTFDDCNNIELKKIAGKLSKAGYIYSTDGVIERVTCPFCLVEAIAVPLEFEPMVVHAQMSPSCTFILLNVGQELVEYAEEWNTSQFAIENEAVELSMLVANYKDGSTIGNDGNYVHLIKRKLESFYKQDISIPESMLCKICYKKKLAVTFLPCTHTIACFECALKIDNCSVCRNPFKVMKADIYSDPEEKKDDQLLCSSSKYSNDDSSDKIFCKVCCKEERDILFIPCNHIYACLNCAGYLYNCPICIKKIDFAIQVYVCT